MQYFNPAIGVLRVLFLTALLGFFTMPVTNGGIPGRINGPSEAIFVLKCLLKICNSRPNTRLRVCLKEIAENALYLWERIDPEGGAVEMPIEVAPKSIRIVFLEMRGTATPQLVASWGNDGASSLKLSFAFNGTEAAVKSSRADASYIVEFKAIPQDKIMGTWIARRWELFLNYGERTCVSRSN